MGFQTGGSLARHLFSPRPARSYMMHLFQNPRILPSLIALAGVMAPVQAQVQVDAGTDQIKPFPASFDLDPSVTGRRPVDFWTADGNHATENHINTYSDALGHGSIGPLTDGGLDIYGWPSDLIRINGTVYGVETGLKYLYTLDETTGVCTPIGGPFSYDWVTCMAYDEGNDILYAVDGVTKQLFTFNRTTGATTPIGGALTQWGQYWYIKGLAFDDVSGMLYAFDDQTETIFTIDPATGVVGNTVMNAPTGDDLYDEITFYKGDLYGSFVYDDPQSGLLNGQVRRFELSTGEVVDVGPVVPDVSPHSLLIHSMPEKTRWEFVSGPGTPTFDNPWALNASVSFDQPGVYELELRVFGESGLVIDKVRLEATFVDCNNNGLNDPLELLAGTSLDLNGNDILDECECYPPPGNYCTSKINSLGTQAFVSTADLPSAALGTMKVDIVGGIPSKPGVLFYGFEQAAIPFQGGTLCVQPPLVRLKPKPMDENGAVDYDIAIDPDMVQETRHYQFWHRDPAHPDGTGVSLSDAMSVTFCL